ncbi:uncharacterized protein [Apostichopus japonicus]|uniref:uncharacterized protein n=1 Tax=Stichopus japonicus TaxID=307972 RepID=UPI003AB7ABCF
MAALQPPKLLLFTMFAFITVNLITPCCAISEVYVAEGGVIHLNFSFSYNGFGRLELRHNNNAVFVRRSDITESNSRTPLLLFDISYEITSFTITDFVSSDNGRYICLLNGQKQDPVYDLSVICAEFVWTQYCKIAKPHNHKSECIQTWDTVVGVTVIPVYNMKIA